MDEPTIEEVIQHEEPTPQELPTVIENQEDIKVHEGVEVRRSGRVRRLPSRYKDYITNEQEMTQTVRASIANIASSKQQEVVAFGALYSPTQENICDDPDPIAIAQKSVIDPDTLYLWEAWKEDDFPKFLEAMQKEVDDHTREGH
jgi:hypothetical protein